MPVVPHSGPRDLYEAAEALSQARGRRCAVCTGRAPGWEGHETDPPCEEVAWQGFRQRLAEVRAIPGESQGVAQWRITRNLFNDVARSVEAMESDGKHAGPIRAARFDALDGAAQRRCSTALHGLLAQFAQLARKHAR